MLCTSLSKLRSCWKTKSDYDNYVHQDKNIIETKITSSSSLGTQTVFEASLKVQRQLKCIPNVNKHHDKSFAAQCPMPSHAG